MSNPARRVTEMFYEMVDDGYYDKDDVIRDLLNWMSEDEVQEFVVRNEYIDTDKVWPKDEV